MLDPGEAMLGLGSRDMPDFLYNSLSDIMEEEGPSSDVRTPSPQMFWVVLALSMLQLSLFVS